GNERVAAYDKQSGELVWEHEVEGITRGLAAANGHLLVSTDNGSIYAFSGSDPAELAADKTKPTAYENDEQKAKFAEAAKRILEDSGVNRGFALVVDAGDARLAYELARQSELKVYAVD